MVVNIGIYSSNYSKIMLGKILRCVKNFVYSLSLDENLKLSYL